MELYASSTAKQDIERFISNRPSLPRSRLLPDSSRVSADSSKSFGSTPNEGNKKEKMKAGQERETCPNFQKRIHLNEAMVPAQQSSIVFARLARRADARELYVTVDSVDLDRRAPRSDLRVE